MWLIFGYFRQNPGTLGTLDDAGFAPWRTMANHGALTFRLNLQCFSTWPVLACLISGKVIYTHTYMYLFIIYIYIHQM